VLPTIASLKTELVILDEFVVLYVVKLVPSNFIKPPLDEPIQITLPFSIAKH
jgi:hypothetical protein